MHAPSHKLSSAWGLYLHYNVFDVIEIFSSCVGHFHPLPLLCITLTSTAWLSEDVKCDLSRKFFSFIDILQHSRGLVSNEVSSSGVCLLHVKADAVGFGTPGTKRLEACRSHVVWWNAIVGLLVLQKPPPIEHQWMHDYFPLPHGHSLLHLMVRV